VRSTTYSKKLIAALHTLTAFCSCKCVNNVTKLNKEGKGWRKMDHGIAVFRWQAMMAKSQGGLQAKMN